MVCPGTQPFPPAPQRICCQRTTKTPSHSAARSNAMSLGGGGGKPEGGMGFEPDGLLSPHPGNAAIGCTEAPRVGAPLAGWPIEGAVADDVEVEVEDGLARTGPVVDHDAVAFEASIGGDLLGDEQQVAE